MFVLRTLRVAWLGVAVFIVLLAVTLSAARLLLPSMSEYKVQIESVAGDFLQRPVQIGSLDAAWHGLSPVLKLNQVVVQDQQFPDGELRIDEVQLALDVVGSLTQRRWLTAGIRVIGISLNLETDLKNRRKVDWGLETINWLLQQESISLEGLDIDWTDAGLFKHAVRFSGLSLKLVNEGSRHQLLLQTDLPPRLGNRLKIAADLNGQGIDLQDWQGRVYLKSEALALDAVEHALGQASLNASGRIDLELWAGISDSRLDWSSGSFVIRGARIETAAEQSQAIDADRLSSAFFIHAAADGWGLGLREFELRRDRRVVWSSAEINLNIHTGSELRIRGDASTLDLKEMHSFTQLLPWVDAKTLIMLDRLQPEGLLREADFEFKHRPGAAPRVSARARIEGLQFAAHAGLPGVSGLSGWIEGNLQSGHLRLDSVEASLFMPKVFRRPLDVAQLVGVVRWQRYAELFRIESQQLRIASGDLDMLTRWQLDWPYDEPSPWLDMQLSLDDFPLAQVRHHLPELVMPPRAVSWLKRAFVAGTATQPRVLLQGRLDQMPFDNGEGRFEARFGFEDVTLAFHPEWGQLDELTGSAEFVGRGMQLIGTSGRIQDSPLERVVAAINDLKRPVLQIEGTVAGTLSGMLAYTNSTPLGARFGGFVRRVAVGGDARLQLVMELPLVQRLGQISVNGVVALDNNELTMKQEDIRFSRIQGELGFTRTGVRADKLRARLLGRPVVASVYQTGAAGDSKTVVDVQGELSVTEVLSEFSMLEPYIKGRSAWQARLEIKNKPEAGQPPLELHLRSDLKGVAIDLPEPFTKPAAQPREFRMASVPGQENRYPVQLNYGDDISAAILLAANRQGLGSVALRFGGGEAKIPQREAIELSGHLDELDLGRWLALFSNGRNSTYKIPPLTVDLAADNFLLGGTWIKDIRAESKRPDPWYFRVEGEGADGWVRWISAERARPPRVMANLRRLVLMSQQSVQDTPERLPAQPTNLPEMDITVGDLSWNQRELGSIRLVGTRSRHGISFETLEMNSPAIDFRGQGAWLNIGGQQGTRFSGAVDGGELGKLTELLGTGNAIQGGELSGEVAADWPGSPADFRLATVAAEFNLATGNGRLPRVDKRGASKLLNLFSLNSLQRRLTLDFSDVYKEGFSFDKMHGRFVIKDGDALTDDFTIEGTSATIEITGRTGLVTRDYEQIVTVTPQVSSTLPIAGAIAGGPVVGAAVFLADKLVGDQFNRITRVRYRVSGSWDDPVYERLEQKGRAKNDTEVEFDEP